MTITTFIIMQGIIFLGSVLQTITGGGLGTLALMFIVTLNLFPLDQATAMIIVLSMFNIFLSIRKQEPVTLAELKSMWYLPTYMITVVLGAFVFFYLVYMPKLHSVLYALLGIISIASAASLGIQNKQRETESSPFAFHSLMSVAGFYGGLFLTSGPATYYLLYRQPWHVDKIRRVSFILFFLGCATRFIWMVVTGEPLEPVLWALAFIPATYVGAILTNKYIHLLNIDIIRKMVCILLLVGGINICIRATQMMLSHF